MKIQLIGLIQELGDTADIPNVMGTFQTPKGIAIAFFPEISVEVFVAIRDAMSQDIARMESERVMLKAMEGPAAGGLQ